LEELITEMRFRLSRNQEKKNLKQRGFVRAKMQRAKKNCTMGGKKRKLIR